jgi:adenylyl cyclase-associated protein
MQKITTQLVLPGIQRFVPAFILNTLPYICINQGITTAQYQAAAAAAPALSDGAPPPPPPPPPVATSGAPSPAVGPAAVFAELNRGEDVTSGLRKVDKSEMTHKNPALRATSVVPASPVCESFC